MELFSDLRSQWDQVLIDTAKCLARPEEKSEVIDARSAPYILEKLSFKGHFGEKKCQFLVLGGPTGVGKGAIGKQLQQNGIARLRRVNTRPQRPGEDPSEYYFVSDREYDSMLKKGELICATSSKTNRAGIKKVDVNQKIKEGKPFFIDGGAGTTAAFKSEVDPKKYSYAIVYVLPPSFDELIARVSGRRLLEQESLQKNASPGEIMSDEHLKFRYERTLKMFPEIREVCDVFVVNDIVSRASERIISLCKL